MSNEPVAFIANTHFSLSKSTFLEDWWHWSKAANFNADQRSTFTVESWWNRIDEWVFTPLFISNLLLFKLCVVSRCLSKGDKENERGLDIISIEMSLGDAPSQTQLQRRFSPCTAFSTCKWQCHQMLSFHQSSQEVMNIQKEKQGLAASCSSTWPNYTDSAFSCEPPLFVSM